VSGELRNCILSHDWPRDQTRLLILHSTHQPLTAMSLELDDCPAFFFRSNASTSAFRNSRIWTVATGRTSAGKSTVLWSDCMRIIFANTTSLSARRADTAEAVVEFWNDKPEVMLSSKTTGPVANMRVWETRTLSGAIPAKTRYIRVRLVSVRHDGKSNDGYFDDLVLTLDAPE